MADLRLPRLPDRTPVKVGIQVTPQLFADLTRYAALYKETYGQEEAVADLIPSFDADSLSRQRPRVCQSPFGREVSDMATTIREAGKSANGMIEPISVRIPTAIAMTGLSRSRIYELIACGEIEIAKDRRSTLIIVASLREAVRRRVVDRGL